MGVDLSLLLPDQPGHRVLMVLWKVLPPYQELVAPFPHPYQFPPSKCNHSFSPLPKKSSFISSPPGCFYRIWCYLYGTCSSLSCRHMSTGLLENLSLVSKWIEVSASVWLLRVAWRKGESSSAWKSMARLPLGQRST